MVVNAKQRRSSYADHGHRLRGRPDGVRHFRRLRPACGRDGGPAQPEKLLADLVRLYEERGVERIALGLPRNMDGTEGLRAEKSRGLKEALEERGCAVTLVDERRTTVEAHAILTEAGKHGKQRKARVDAVAAALILETYLNGRREA